MVMGDTVLIWGGGCLPVTETKFQNILGACIKSLSDPSCVVAGAYCPAVMT